MNRSSDNILEQLHRDLTNRARGGIAIYFGAWLLIALSFEYQQQHPAFFAFNSTIFLLTILSRLLHLLVYKKRLPIPLPLLHHWLVYTILLAGLHWGLLTLWTLSHDAYREISIFLLLTAASLGIAGTITLGISRRIGLVYPLVILLPVIYGLLLRGAVEDILLSVMAALALVYAYVASRTASQDYWRAIDNQALLEERARQLEKLSITDQLTQLNNRAYFDRRYAEEWKRCQRLGSALSLLILDLDHFKNLNDSHGHVFGDLCLQKVGEVLQATRHRESDVIARYGGEEFVILLADTEEACVESIAERFRLAIAGIELDFEGHAVALSCSIGGSSIYPDRALAADLLLKQADIALYRAKDGGRNQFQLFDKKEVDEENDAVA